jgi:hypothetical protein
MGREILSALRFLKRITKNGRVMELLVRNPSVDRSMLARDGQFRHGRCS